MFLKVFPFSISSATQRGNRERRPAVQDAQDNGLRVGSRGLQDHADVAGRNLRLDGARGHQELHLLESERRLELRRPPLGAPNRRDSLQRDRPLGSCLWCCGQQTHITDSEHVSTALA